MSYISECPVTESAWNQRSVVKACSPPGNYHCVRTQDGGIRELCTHPIWMQAGKCPYYNKAGRLDSSNCRRRRTLKCPTAVYISNQVFKYPSCFPEKREVTTDLDKSLPTSFVQQNITLPVNHGPEESGGDNSALAALILFVLPLVLAIVIFWKRKEIYMWINNKQKRRQKMTSKKDSTDLPLDKERHDYDGDIEEGNIEKKTLLDNPEKTINENKDDMVIFAESPEGLQKMLNTLYNYTEEWSLSVNVTKTKIVVFRNGGKLRNNESWFYNNAELEIVNEFKYLDMLFNFNGKFLKTQKHAAEQGRKAMFAISSKLKRCGEENLNQFDLFRARAFSISSYNEIKNFQILDQTENN
ncbi:uncharacterized protein LOC134238927 [Saccostrea cucullata]|uniref:uncharacterized protein LOC134238927 n=1 Tax=Saccostrea cuccullata TaxID=36930 RepID=UPI002ED3EF13